MVSVFERVTTDCIPSHKATGTDGISFLLVTFVASETVSLSPPTELNQVHQGSSPCSAAAALNFRRNDEWKVATVMSLHKVRSKESKSNYLPVSVYHIAFESH